jgi:hypothetical protein
MELINKMEQLKQDTLNLFEKIQLVKYLDRDFKDYTKYIINKKDN